MSERTIGKVGCEVGSTVLARYYKGAVGNGDNIVIEMSRSDEYEKDYDTRHDGQE